MSWVGHELYCSAGKSVLPADGEGMKLLLLALYVLVCLAFAALFHHLLEKPAVRWSTSFRGQRKPAVQARDVAKA